MRLLDTFSIAARGLGRHWTRAALNVTGIFAGVASVVLLIAVAHSVTAASKANVEGLGSDTVVIYPGAVSSSGVQVGIGTNSSITTDDVTALGDPARIPDGIAAVPTTGLRDNVSALTQVTQTDIIGTTELFASVRGYTVREGHFIDAADLQAGGAQKVVLGSAVASTLFTGLDAVGQTVHINGAPFDVIGVFASRGYSGTFNQDDLVVMPISSAWSYVLPTASPRIEQVLIEASSPNATAKVKTEATNTLLQRHHITNPTQADFQVQTQQDLIASAQRLGTVMKWMLAVIATISLLTGAIGIMSMMLASVRERGYEIGIRRAVGATWGNILSQFLVEALLLACIGGIVGIALGIGGAQVMGDIVTDLPAPVVTYAAVVIAAAVALVIGIGAGLYPAARAASLQPAEAVRRR
jgi:putative ABC transport system permease protein